MSGLENEFQSGLGAAPLVPWAALAALALAAALLTLVGVKRETAGRWWRAAGFALVLTALANPLWTEASRQPLPDLALVLVDKSASQSLGERPQQIEETVAALAQRWQGKESLTFERREIGNNATPEGEKTGGRGRSTPSGPVAGDGTRMFAALNDALAEIPRQQLGAVIMVTDGQIHDAPAIDRESNPYPVPVHFLLTGKRDERDRRLVIEAAPHYGLVGNDTELTVTIADLPAQEDTPNQTPSRVPVTLRQDGGEESVHWLLPNQATRIPVTIGHRGANAITLEADTIAGELTPANNRAALVIHGVRDRLRVLLVSGEPHAGERIWRNLLKSDAAVDLVHFTILRPPEKQDFTPISDLALISFPVRELFQEKISGFDLVIFDRYRQRGILPEAYLENIVTYVREGGALLVASGPEFADIINLYETPLGKILPAAPKGEIVNRGFRPAVTELGHLHPVTAPLATPGKEDGARWGRWFRRIGAEVKSGHSIMSGEEAPLLVIDRAGKGRVAQILSDHIWLWSRGFEGGGPDATLLRRLAHWLMKEPDLEEERLSAHSDGTRLMIERRSLEPKSRSVTVQTPAGSQITVPLTYHQGVGTAHIVTDAPGLYHLDDGQRQAVVIVAPEDEREFTDMRSTGHLVAPVAAATGGGVFWLEDGLPDLRHLPGPPPAARIMAGEDWLGVVRNRASTITGAAQTAIFPTSLLILAAAAAFIIAWWRESR